MKRNILIILLAVLSLNISAQAPKTPVSQMEKLNRGLIAIHKSSGGNYVTWRLLGTDAENTTFDLYRDGSLIASNQSLTSYSDTKGTAESKYKVITHQDGKDDETSATVQAWDNIYKNIKLNRPKADISYMTNAADSDKYYSYTPQDCSVADLDGDGDYELVIKWNPTNARDNASGGFTGEPILDAYKIIEDGNIVSEPKMLWRVNLGINIRSGSHYTQFMVYDFNRDGKAEMICKTAPGSIDGQGKYVSDAADDAEILATDNTADYRTNRGYILTGPEYLTVFDGETGAAIHTIWYNPNRNFSASGVGTYNSEWGDTYGNRGDRYLACVAYLRGPNENPSAVMCRGYYTRSYLWAVNFDGKKLSTLWRHASISKNLVQVTDSTGKTTTKMYTKNTSGAGNSNTAYGQGNHNLSVADVDGDGADEIIYGSATINNDGSLLYTTGLGHGDAIHVGDLMPDRPGLEVFTVHEESPYGLDCHDAETGELLFYKTGTGDNGRGMAADWDLTTRGYEFWSADNYDVYDNNFNVISTDRPPYSHRVYWLGTPRDVMLDAVSIYYSAKSKSVRLGEYGGTACAGGSKAYPNISADILGDWREEVILFCKTDSASLNIFSTTETTNSRLATLMHDHTYRMGIAWQNVAYNQPPHLGYYLADSIGSRLDYEKTLNYQEIELGQEMQTISGKTYRATKLSVNRTLLDSKVIKYLGVPSCFTYTYDAETGDFSLSGTPESTGLYQIVLKTTGNPTGTELVDTVKINVKAPTGIIATQSSSSSADSAIYNLSGQRVDANYKGIVIKNRRKFLNR